MRDVTIRDYIGTARELTAAEVRRLPAGTRVIRHSFDRRGTHQTLEMTVVRHGCSHALAYRDVVFGLLCVRKIAKETDRMCYTELKEG